MTDAEKNIKQIDLFLNQHCDGFVLLAFNPLDGEPMSAVSTPDGKCSIALNSMMGGLLASGGVDALKERIKQKKKEGEEGKQ